MSIRNTTKNKKAMVEAQLTWVFVLIVGAILLMFFVGVATKQKELSDLKSSANLLRELDSLITGSEVGNIEASSEMPNLDLKLTCDSFAVKAAQRLIKNRVVFGPDIIKGRELVSYSIPWDMPYRVTNFLYLTSSEVRYILIKTPSNFDLPPVVNFDEFDYLNEVHDENNYKVKLVFFGPAPTTNVPVNIQNLDGEVTAIRVSGNIEGDGFINFYDVHDGEFRTLGSSNFVGRASAIAAIFAEDKEQYDCVMAKALKKLEVVTDIYQQRVSYFTDDQCSYTSLYGLPSPLTLDKSSEINSFAQTVESENEDKIRYTSCPEIY